MQKTLLIGNGLNRISQEKSSWSNLIKRLAEQSGTQTREGAPFPIEFERIAARLAIRPQRSRKDQYLELKKQLAALIREDALRPTALHYSLRNIGADYLVTTNYDLCLESALDTTPCGKLGTNQKYLIEATAQSGDCKIFHAHGSIDCPTSMCLGYEHYLRYVARMKGILMPPPNKDGSILDIVSKMKGKTENKASTWPELFFLSDVYIIGLELDYCESDLWWLITHRAALISSDPELRDNCNEIKYFVVDSQDTSKKDQAEKSSRLGVMEDLYVNPIHIPAESYEEGYGKILGLITSEWNSRQ